MQQSEHKMEKGTLSRLWDPNKMFDVTASEKRAIEERAQIKTDLRKEWQKKVSSPYRGVNGYIFDPAVQRFLSMKANYYHQFKSTPKNFAYFLGAFVIPLGIYIALTDYEIKSYDARCRRGEVTYEDRKGKFI